MSENYLAKEVEEIKERVLMQLDITRENEEERLFEVIDREISDYAREKVLPLSKRCRLRVQIFHSLRRLDVLQELLDRDDITEIMVNGAGKIFYEKGGKIHLWNQHFSSAEKLEDIIQQMVGNNNRMINTAQPIADTRLADGSRVNVVLSPVALDGPVVTIRKFPRHPLGMAELLEGGSIGEECVSLLEQLVRAGYNIFISGSTGSGKTTFLNALSAFIPESERVITIEDSAELQLQGIPNLVRLETRNAGIEGNLEITIRELIRTALRMRPDRIIVGEVRGAECLDMLQAMNTGHDGSLSTGHANSCRDMLNRMETMVLMGMELPLPAIRAQIASGIDIMVHLGRLRDKSRRVLSIMELNGVKGGEICLNPLYEFAESGIKNEKITGRWEKRGEILHREKLAAAGMEGENAGLQ